MAPEGEPVSVPIGPMPDRLSATRAAGLARLSAFVPSAARTYAARRNYDVGYDSAAGPMGQMARANVSVLSPYVRHRLVSEQEVVTAVLGRHSAAAAEKFIQEVCWRTYWKGWLEMRPQVWTHYLDDVRLWRARLEDDADLAGRLAAAERGETGIACFDVWVRELVDTGYLHNHARMWFASIWTHTLDLPWPLGADFFLRHLLDGDPASNTLSWRWVVGLQTAGKTYLARADNIATYTDGRFSPRGQLADHAPVLTEDIDPGRPVRPAPADVAPPAGTRVVVLLSEDDLTPEQWPVDRDSVMGVVGLRTADAYPGTGERVIAFKQAALADAMARSQSYFAGDLRSSAPVLVQPVGDHAAETTATVARVRAFADGLRAEAVVTMGNPVGPTADRVGLVLAALARDGLAVHGLRRRWDDLFWPHATAGFFKLREKIPAVLRALDLGPEVEAGLK